MKPFAKYLAESERTYQYRIKVAGDVPADFFRQLKDKCSQFDVVKMSEPRKTPIRKQIPDFPAFPNESLNIVDVEFKYPAIEPQIKQLAQLLHFDPNRIVMNTLNYEESLNDESTKIADENKDLIADPEYPTPDAEQRALKKDYSAEPHQHEVVQNAFKSKFEVAGGRTPPAKTTNDLPTGNKSPMSRIKLPPKPATGRQPRG